MKKTKHNRTVRFSTLIKLCGVPLYCDQLCGATWERLTRKWLASDWHRVLTIHHGETFSNPFWAEPGKHAGNVIGFCIFKQPIPADVGMVVGVGRYMGKLKEWTEVFR